MCKFLKGERWDDSDCPRCLPFLLEENEDAALIYMLTQGQLIFGPKGPVDINQLAVHEAMKLYRIENKKDCFEKVLRLAGHFIEKARMESRE